VTIKYHKQFKKHFKERVQTNKSSHQRFNERVKLFIEFPNDPTLRDHKLTGKKSQFRAFSIAGDVRVVYFKTEDFIYFIDVGSHNQVY